MICWHILCHRDAVMIVYVRDHHRSWASCAYHGKYTIQSLMSVFTRQGIFTRKVRPMAKCQQGPESNPCPYEGQLKFKPDTVGSEWQASCFRHIASVLRPLASGGRAPRMIVDGAR